MTLLVSCALMFLGSVCAVILSVSFPATLAFVCLLIIADTDLIQTRKRETKQALWETRTQCES